MESLKKSYQQQLNSPHHNNFIERYQQWSKNIKPSILSKTNPTEPVTQSGASELVKNEEDERGGKTEESQPVSRQRRPRGKRRQLENFIKSVYELHM